MKILDKEKLLRDVRNMGYEIGSIDELMKMCGKDRRLILIVLEHLKEIDDESDKQFIVRCLSVRGFTEATRPLLDEFYKASNESYKWAIGNAFYVIRDREAVDEFAEIIKDGKHGTARQMIVLVMGKFKDEKVVPILIDLLDDPDVTGHAISALSCFNNPELVCHVRPFLRHKTTWIRNKAKKTIVKWCGQNSGDTLLNSDEERKESRGESGQEPKGKEEEGKKDGGK